MTPFLTVAHILLLGVAIAVGIAAIVTVVLISLTFTENVMRHVLGWKYPNELTVVIGALILWAVVFYGLHLLTVAVT